MERLLPVSGVTDPAFCGDVEPMGSVITETAMVGKGSALTDPFLRISAAARDAVQRSDQGVDVLANIVEGERGADGALVAEAPEDRLRTVVTRAHRDAVLVERRAYILVLVAVD